MSINGDLNHSAIVVVMPKTQCDSSAVEVAKRQILLPQANVENPSRAKALSEVRVKEREFANPKHKMLYDYLMSQSEAERAHVIRGWIESGSSLPAFIDIEDISDSVALEPERFLDLWIRIDNTIRDGFAHVVNLGDSYGHTPLHYLAMKGDRAYGLAEFLLSQGAVANSKSSFGTTPHDLAAMDKGSDLERLFNQHLPKVGEEAVVVAPPAPDEPVSPPAQIFKVQAVAKPVIKNLQTVVL